MKKLLTKSLVTSVLLAGLFLTALPATASTVRVGPNDKATVYKAFNLQGEVCVEVRSVNGNASVDFWHAGIVNRQFGYRTAGIHCFPVKGYLNLRTGFSTSGMVDVRVISENTKVFFNVTHDFDRPV